jgi:predicted dehydrogenase
MVVPGAFSFWADAAIARIVSEGSIGTLRGGRLVWSGGVYDADPWRRHRRISGINTMALGIVYEAVVRWIGRASWVSAATVLHEPTMPGPDGSEITVDVPDHVVAITGYPGDALMTFEVTADERPEGHACWLHGTEGTLRADFDRRRLELIGPDGRSRRVAIAATERRRWSVERDFIAAIRDGRPATQNDFATAWHGIAFTDAVIRSARTGRRVAIADAV